MVIYHKQMELFFAFFFVNSGEQHTAGINAHHGPGRQVRDSDAGLAHQLLRLIILVDAGEDHPIRAGAVVQNELQELLGLLHGLAFLDLHGPEIGLGEGVKIHQVGEQRFDLHVGEVDLLLHDRGGGSGLGGLCGLLVGIQRLHCRDKIPHMEKLCRSPVNTVLCLQVAFSRV